MAGSNVGLDCRAFKGLTVNRDNGVFHHIASDWAAEVLWWFVGCRSASASAEVAASLPYKASEIIRVEKSTGFAAQKQWGCNAAGLWDERASRILPSRFVGEPLCAAKLAEEMGGFVEQRAFRASP